MTRMPIHSWLLILVIALLVPQWGGATAGETLLVDLNDTSRRPAPMASVESPLAQTTEPSVHPEVQVPDTAGLRVVEHQRGWQAGPLRLLSDPNLAFVLLLIGFYGLVYELVNPGTLLPGILGALCLVLALYSFQLLSVNWAGLALLVIGLGLMLAEAFAPSLGALGLSGAAVFILGSLTLIDTETTGAGISVALIIGFAAVSALLLFFVVGLAIKAQRRPVASGAEELHDALGTAVSGFPGAGSVRVHGEIWSARSLEPIAHGRPIRVCARDGLILLVEPLSQSEE
ncbi:NfeD family protein [Lamprocystis purpurea]|uniref:NfeD family protein n=1 Tax=Lamprocystis purpurea TaxID=61598 RepID=UPI001B7FED67|nr:NfeD family protein [Lamprocystis purpurea]